MAGFNEYVKALAARYRGNALPWPELNAQGKGLMQSDDYLMLLTTRWAEFQTIGAKYNLRVGADEMEAALAALGDTLNDHAAVFLKADLVGQLEVAARDSFAIPGPVLRAMLSVSYTQMDKSYFAHMHGSWRALVRAGKKTVQQAEEDANTAYRVMGALLLLEQAGMLAPAAVTATSPVAGLGFFDAVYVPNGLGAAAAAPVVAVVLQVALMIAICFVFYLVWESWERYKIFETCCIDKDGKPVQPTTEWCKTFCTGVGERGKPGTDPFARFMGDLGSGLSEGVKWAAIIAGGALAVALVLPLIRRRTRPALRSPGGYPAMVRRGGLV